MKVHIAAIVFALGLAACKNEGEPYACTCDMLTDFDDAHKEAVLVCAASATDAVSIAQGCAQLANPMPVQTCACTPTGATSPPCRQGCLPSDK
ncbi:MAG: hypothetical protein IPK82_39030 [Polyangiaceae bacterium]|nr:hypothetical protein [Polyangiaceae bacterium]